MEASLLSLYLLEWYDRAHRPLPWRETKDPYRIWVSEIMLQQTRVETVIGYYHRFLEAFPTPGALAYAPEQEVLKLWEGLGYYSRARNLQKAMKMVMENHNGEVPRTMADIRVLCGIGPYTAGAVLSIAYDVPVPAVDGNVLRVLARLYGIHEDILLPKTQKLLTGYAEALVPKRRAGDFNQALMELGATVCTPRGAECGVCPWQSACEAYKQDLVGVLPLRAKAAEKKVEEHHIVLVLSGRRVLVRPRTERLLRGLYEFPSLYPAISDEGAAKAMLDQMGLSRAKFLQPLSKSKHVFTHKVWQMQGSLFEAAGDAEGWQWVDAEAFAVLPFPTALKAYVEVARMLL